jgi:hypothetical protein
MQLRLNIPYSVHRFIQRICQVRETQQDPEYGLLNLAHDFRYRKVTVRQDKIYALRVLYEQLDTSLVQK